VSASVSENGTLVYARGAARAPQRLTWFDRAGRVLGTLGEAPYIPGRQGRHVALSPDEKRVAVALGTGKPENRDIWIIDTVRDIRAPRVTVDPGADWSPVWSPDGTRIAFAAERSGRFSLRWKLVDGSAPDEALLEHEDAILPTAWSADGRFIAYTLTRDFPRRADIWVLPLFGDRQPFPVAQTPFHETSAMFSPNGEWIAYTSEEAGELNVYLRRLRGGAAIQVSRDGGGQPAWRADGKELFFLGPDGSMMAAPIGPADQVGAPQTLFSAMLPSTMTLAAHQYAVTGDGKRFLVIARPDQPSMEPLTVVIDWPASVQK
jgi:Tol biopolymer transport system component